VTKPRIMIENLIEHNPVVVEAPTIIYDTAELQAMTEETRKEKGLPKGAIMVIEAKVFHAGKVTSNGRLYHPQLMRAEVARLSEDVKERRVKGLAGHPEPDKAPDPSAVAFVPLGLWMKEDNSGWMQAAVPDTTKGRDLAALARMDVKVGFSQRGRGVSNKVEMNDKHPLFMGNEHWAGKVVEDVSDHYGLDTFDWVDNQAVRDAELSNYQESEEPMSFKIEDLTDEQWASILESDKVKAQLAEARKDVTAEHVRKLGESTELAKLLASNKDLVEGLAKNDVFLAALEEAVGDDGTEPEPEEKKVECTTCKKQIAEGSTFCAACGARQVAMTEGVQPDQPVDEKDKAITALQESNAKLVARLDESDKRDKERVDKEACDKAIAEAIQDKPERVQTATRKMLESKKDKDGKSTLTPENIADEVKDAIEFVEGLVVTEAPADGGTAVAQPGDEARQKTLAEGTTTNVDDGGQPSMSEAMKTNMELLD